MKTLLRSAAAMCLTAVLFASLNAQITITAADVGAQLAPGNTLNSHLDTATHSIDIGSPGATSWNYSALGDHSTYEFESVDPDTTPFASYFPGATHCLRWAVPGLGVSYSYQELGTNLLMHGSGANFFLQSRTVKHPPEVLDELPMTFGSSWTSTTVDSTIITAPPIVSVTNQVVQNSVDAYGTLTLPGSGPYQALRIRSDRRSTSGLTTVRTITYMIVAENGAAANLVAADTLQPNSGTISVSGISWNAPIATDVLPDAPVPASFMLHQNYPNPFNPSTTIGFDLPAGSFVRLTVTDILGRTVATLVDGVLQPGSHREVFDARDLPGGVYFCRLVTANGSFTTKMLLTR